MLRTLCLATVLPLLASCLTAQQPDLDQLKRMRAESNADRIRESIGCIARDRVCAQLVQLRGEACAEGATQMLDTTAAERAQLRHCALADARRLPGLLPADAPAPEQDDTASTVFEAWRGALDADDPAADSADLDAAANGLRAMPAGAPYASTLQAAGLIHVAVRSTRPGEACSALAQAIANLPPAPPSTLAQRVARERSTAIDAQAKMGCAR